jgi:hypothetical protein
LADRPLDQPPDQTDQETQNRVTAHPVRIDHDTPQSRSAQPLDQPDRKNPIAQRMWPAGSFFGDFRTPVGARNSSRMRNGSFEVSNGDKQTFLEIVDAR